MYNDINVFYHTVDTYGGVVLRIFTHAHAASFNLTRFVKLTLF